MSYASRLMRPTTSIVARSVLRSLAGALAVAACGSNGPSSSGASADGGSPEATPGGDDAADHGSVSATYPAFTVDMPQVAANQGIILRSPVIVTVTWPAHDPNAATWDFFADLIGPSSYWSAATSEYGVNPASSGAANHVHMVQPLPKTMSYFDLQNFVLLSLGGMVADSGAPEGGMNPGDAAMPEGGIEAGDGAGQLEGDAVANEAAVSEGGTEAGDGAVPEGGVDAGDGGVSDGGASAEGGGANPPWPVPLSPDGGAEVPIVYALFIPASTTVVEPGTGRSFCSEGGLGYHDSANVNGKFVPYSIVLECASQTLPELEESAAHELVEAVTDPFGLSATQLGYNGFDSDHLAWSLYTGDFGNEIADVCQNWADSYYQESSPFPFWVQRVWSNAHAIAGRDPCVPAPSTPYYGMTFFPAQQARENVDLSAAGMGTITTLGFRAPVGQPVTFQVGFYSDSPSDPWTIAYDFPQVTLSDLNFNPISNGAATVTIDKTSGQNGEKAYVTVTPSKAGALGFQRMAITWDPPAGDARATGFSPHYQPVILFNK